MGRSKKSDEALENMAAAVENMAEAVSELADDNKEDETKEEETKEEETKEEETKEEETKEEETKEEETPKIETIINEETGKEEIIVTEENAAQVAAMLSDDFAADPIPFDAPAELSLGGVPYEFDADEFQSHIKESLKNILERSQMPREFYNAKHKIKHELQRLIDSI